LAAFASWDASPINADKVQTWFSGGDPDARGSHDSETIRCRFLRNPDGLRGFYVSRGDLPNIDKMAR
jgi:hypothetical protein